MASSPQRAPQNAAREPAVADMFYPGDEARLRDMVTAMLESSNSSLTEIPDAIISPHAGFVYSGPVAASAYAPFYFNRENRIKRVVLIGPSHRVPFDGLALSARSAYRTPLGDVPLDLTSIQNLYHQEGIQVLDRAHAFEHSLEVQLPFLQVIFQDISIIPVVTGRAGPASVARFLEPFLLDPETLIVISSDLSHYNDYETARKKDRETADAIVNLDSSALKQDDACGRTPIRGMIELAIRHDMHCKNVDLRSSGDTAGSPGQVVGYGAFHFFR